MMLILALFSPWAHAEPQCPANLEPSPWVSIELRAGEVGTVGIPANVAGDHDLQILNDRTVPQAGSVRVFKVDPVEGGDRGQPVEDKVVTYRTQTSDAPAAHEEVLYLLQFTADEDAVFWVRLCLDHSGNL